MSSPAALAACVDLHMHSTASDGSRAPADVVRAAKAAALVAIALTDHDSVEGLAEAQAAGAELGVRIVNGTEDRQWRKILVASQGLASRVAHHEKNRIEMIYPQHLLGLLRQI